MTEREIPIANACEAPEGDDGDGRGQNSYGLYRMWLGPYGTQVYVWADSFDSAFEVHGQYIPSHEWGGDDVDSDSEEYAAVHAASLDECDGDVGYGK